MMNQFSYPAEAGTMDSETMISTINTRKAREDIDVTDIDVTDVHFLFKRHDRCAFDGTFKLKYFNEYLYLNSFCSPEKYFLVSFCSKITN